MRSGGIFEIGDILVDRSILNTTFLCTPDLCIMPSRKKWRSCCADLDLPLTAGERFRLRKFRRFLESAIGNGERNSTRFLDPKRTQTKDFWIDEHGCLRRPSRRCIFSAIDRRNQIRCQLHMAACALGVAVDELQPIACRLFPLVLVNLKGRVLLTVLSRKNHRIWQALPPNRFPCLSVPTNPPLIHSMRTTLDWIFGRGFARSLKKAQNQL